MAASSARPARATSASGAARPSAPARVACSSSRAARCRSPAPRLPAAPARACHASGGVGVPGLDRAREGPEVLLRLRGEGPMQLRELGGGEAQARARCGQIELGGRRRRVERPQQRGRVEGGARHGRHRHRPGLRPRAERAGQARRAHAGKIGGEHDEANPTVLVPARESEQRFGTGRGGVGGRAERGELGRERPPRGGIALDDEHGPAAERLGERSRLRHDAIMLAEISACPAMPHCLPCAS